MIMYKANINEFVFDIIFRFHPINVNYMRTLFVSQLDWPNTLHNIDIVCILSLNPRHFLQR